MNGATVSFDLDSPDLHQTGTVSGSSMWGVATWIFDFGSGTDPVTLTGTWEAIQQ